MQNRGVLACVRSSYGEPVRVTSMFLESHQNKLQSLPKLLGALVILVWLVWRGLTWLGLVCRLALAHEQKVSFWVAMIDYGLKLGQDGVTDFKSSSLTITY